MQTTNSTNAFSSFYSAPFSWLRENSNNLPESQKKYFETARNAAINFTDAAIDFGTNNFKINQDITKALNETAARKTAELFAFARRITKIQIDFFSAGNNANIVPEYISENLEKQSLFIEQFATAYREAAFSQINFTRVFFNPFSSLYSEWLSTYKRFLQDANDRTHAFTVSQLKAMNSAVESAVNNNSSKVNTSSSSPDKKSMREADKRAKESVLE